MLRLAKLRPLLQSLDSSSSHQLMQRCSVSRTAKGKAKIKSGQPLKRSKISTKKGAAETRDGGGRGSRERLYEQCLNAPTPLRYLNAKQRAREAYRLLCTLSRSFQRS